MLFKKGDPQRGILATLLYFEKASDEYLILRKYQTSPYAHSIVRAEVLPTALRLEPR